jgi:hypothetical protein
MLPRNSAAEQSIDRDGRERPNADGDRIHMGLNTRVEHQQTEPAGEAARERAREDFDNDESTAPWTSMPVCKVALAAGTSRHLLD